METINKNIILYLVWLIAVAAILTAVWFLLSSKMSRKPELPSSDTVAIHSEIDGNQTVIDTTARYAINVPSDWYVEKKAGSGMTIYPGYDPTQDIPATCKIEISVLPNPTHASLDSWLDYYLHADPTVDIVETARTPLTISGYPAITWSGMLNGVSTTLTYISREDFLHGSVYEIAPSEIETDSSAATNDTYDATCQDAARVLLNNFQTLP